MGANIALTGLAMNDPVPGQYVEILFAQGPSAGFAGQRKILLIGNKTTAGNATPDTVIYGPDTPIPAQTENDIINLTGPGSEIHTMWRRCQKASQGASSIYFICVTESAGASATMVFTLLNVPTGAGNVRIFVGDEAVDTAFAASDTLATITAAMVLSINGKSYWPVTAAQTTASTANDSVTITARNKGPRGNWIRGQALLTFGNGGTPNTTITNTTDAFLAGGTTADSNTTALATLLSSSFYYIASSAEDASQFGAVVSQVNSQALPISGIRQRAFAGSVDTQSNVDTIAVGLNAARSEILWQLRGIWRPCELAAWAAGAYAQFENSGAKPLCNWSGFPRNNAEQAAWGPVPQRDRTAWPTRTTIKTALLNGVTPIGVYTSGTAYLVKRITTRSLNGANPDYRIRDAHKVTVCDFFADDLLAKQASNLGGKNLTDDVAQGQPPPPPDTTTPNRLRDLINGLLDDYAVGTGKALLQQMKTTKAELIVQREPANPSRLSASVGLWTIDVLDQVASQVQQVG